MSKKSIGLVGLVLGFVVATTPAGAQEACTELTYTGHPDYAPISFRDGDAIAGAGATLIEEVAGRLGIPVRSIAVGNWDETQLAVRNGEIDMIFSLYFNDDRATYLEFVEPPFVLNPEVAIARAGEAFDFAGWDDLIGKRGVTIVGESFGIAFDAFIEESLDVARVDRLADAFEALLADEADYLVFGQFPALAEAARLGVRDQVEVLSPPLLEGDLYVAFSQQSPCLPMIGAFGAEIQAMLDAGEIDDLIAEADQAWNEAVAP